MGQDGQNGTFGRVALFFAYSMQEASQSLAINFVTAKVFRSGYHSMLKATVAIVTTIDARHKKRKKHAILASRDTIFMLGR